MRKLTILFALILTASMSFAQGNGKTGTIASSKAMTNAVADTSAVPFATKAKHVVMSLYVDALTGTTGGTVYFEQYIVSTNRWFVVSSATILATDNTYGYNFGFIPAGNCRIRTSITGTQTSTITTTYGFL